MILRASALTAKQVSQFPLRFLGSSGAVILPDYSGDARRHLETMAKHPQCWRRCWPRLILLLAIGLDMISVLFGGVTALLPIYAGEILMVGPKGLGALRAAPTNWVSLNLELWHAFWGLCRQRFWAELLAWQVSPSPPCFPPLSEN